MMEEFEQKLDELVTEAIDSGMSYEDVISAFELKVYALKEEMAD